MEPRKCRYCLRMFRPRSGSQRYCNPACRTRAYKGRGIVRCASQARFGRLSKLRPAMRTCLVCGRSFPSAAVGNRICGRAGCQARRNGRSPIGLVHDAALAGDVDLCPDDETADERG